jgi:transcriptional regulator with XRE-family HTH domain
MFALCASPPEKALRGPQTLRLAKRFALCKLRGMDTPTDFAAAAGISVPYASQILSGKRAPAMPLAISIYRKTGRKFGPIIDVPDDEIDILERHQGLAA